MSEQLRNVDPDAPISVGWISIFPDYDGSPVAHALNHALKEAGRKERMRILVFEDRIFAQGMWTQEKAAEIAKTSKIIGGYYTAPESELSHQEGPGWAEIAFKVDKGVVDSLVERGLLFPIEGKRENYALELSEKIYGKNPYFVEVSVTETDEQNVMNFTLSQVEQTSSDSTIH